MAKFRAAGLGKPLPQMNREHRCFPPHMLMTLAGKVPDAWGDGGELDMLEQEATFIKTVFIIKSQVEHSSVLDLGEDQCWHTPSHSLERSSWGFQTVWST